VKGLRLCATDPQDHIVPHILPVRGVEGRKDAVVRALADKGIPTGVHYKPNHLLSFFGGGSPSLPVTEALYAQILTLPLHPGLSNADVDAVCDALAAALS
jgi:dTDP-4-amino-4,6-dideoxygalactose transaminase